MAADSQGELIFEEMTDYIRSLQPELQRRLPVFSESFEIVRKLNTMFAGALGAEVEIESGLEYAMSHGACIGMAGGSGRDMGDRPKTGVRGRGLLAGFEVYKHNDVLIARGTPVDVLEPCLIYRNPKPRVSTVQRPYTHSNVPLVRLGSVAKAPAPQS